MTKDLKHLIYYRSDAGPVGRALVVVSGRPEGAFGCSLCGALFPFSSAGWTTSLLDNLKDATVKASPKRLWSSAWSRTTIPVQVWYTTH